MSTSWLAVLLERRAELGTLFVSEAVDTSFWAPGRSEAELGVARESGLPSAGEPRLSKLLREDLCGSLVWDKDGVVCLFVSSVVMGTLPFLLLMLNCSVSEKLMVVYSVSTLAAGGVG